MNHEGESAVARVAGRLGIPYALSTLGTTSPEDLAAAAPGTDKWFQLYLWRDREASRQTLDDGDEGLPMRFACSGESERHDRVLGRGLTSPDTNE